MMSPLVSVIIPVYNVEEYLDKFLNTVTRVVLVEEAESISL